MLTLLRVFSLRLLRTKAVLLFTQKRTLRGSGAFVIDSCCTDILLYIDFHRLDTVINPHPVCILYQLRPFLFQFLSAIVT